MKSALLLTHLLLTSMLNGANAQITVCQSGCNSSTIQGGINQAIPGQTVQVTDIGAFTYTENLNFLGKDITVEVAPGAGPITVMPASFASSTVTFANGEGRGAVLRGFILSGATHAPAITCLASSPTIDGNTITGNGTANVPEGGGIRAVSAAPRIENNVISSNLAGSRGGGLFASGNSSALGQVLEIENNLITDNGSEFQGGGAALVNVDAAIVQSNTFSGNDTAFSWPIHCDSNAVPGGGGIALIASGGASVSLLDNDFEFNHSWQFGGAVLCVESSPVIRSTQAAGFNGNGAECNGGAIALLHNSSPKVRGYLFQGNFASVNGGSVAAMYSSDAIFRKCVIEDSGCLGADGPSGIPIDAYGGGIFIQDAAPTIKLCTITRCFAAGSDDAFGGGIAVVDGPDPGNTSPRIRDCTITQNQAHTAGAGIYSGTIGQPFGLLNQTVTIKKNLIAENGTFDFLTDEPRLGGGIATDGGNVFIARNTILANRASEAGAGIHAQGMGDLSAISGNMVVKNNLMGAAGFTSGSGVGIWFSGDVERLISNTIARNRSLPTSVGGGLYVEGGTAEVWDCIVWSNDGLSDIDGQPTVYFSDVDKWLGWSNGSGNIRVNPQFVSPENDDFHLKFSSGCIDRGDSSVPGLLVLDIDGETRVQNIRLDMGADERRLPIQVGPQ